MAALLMEAGADPTLKTSMVQQEENREGDLGGGGGKSAFTVFLESMPEGCNVALNSYLVTNGKSAGAKDLEVRISFELLAKELSAADHSSSSKRYRMKAEGILVKKNCGNYPSGGLISRFFLPGGTSVPGKD